MNYCGIDAHTKSSAICVLDEQGNKVKLEKTASTERGLWDALGTMDREMQVIIEACSSSKPVYKHLVNMGFTKAIFVNPCATAQMRARGKKTDFVDAQGLAELARLGLSEAWKVHIPGEWAQNMRKLLYAREFVVKHRVAITNRVKAVLRVEGRPVPALKGESGWRKLPELMPEYLDDLNCLREVRGIYLKRELKLTSMIKGEVSKHPQYKLINSVPCVGALTAAVLLSCIDDIRRFQSGKALSSYLGLVPSVYQSGAVERTGSITKRGNALARKFLAQAAHHARYSSNPFNAVYRDLLHRKGTGRAVIVVARKIAQSVYAVLKYEAEFNPAKMGLVKVDEEVSFTREYERAHKVAVNRRSSPVAQ